MIKSTDARRHNWALVAGAWSPCTGVVENYQTTGRGSFAVRRRDQCRSLAAGAAATTAAAAAAAVASTQITTMNNLR